MDKYDTIPYLGLDLPTRKEMVDRSYDIVIAESGAYKYFGHVHVEAFLGALERTYGVEISESDLVSMGYEIYAGPYYASNGPSMRRR